MAVRILMGPGAGSEVVAEEQLRDLYAVPAQPWLRVNMVSTLDGAAQGDDGHSDGINNAVDKRVFHALRRLADALVVGAGTVRSERYRPTAIPLVVVSRSGEVPPSLLGAKPGTVVMATVATARGLARSRDLLGEENVWVLGAEAVDLVELKRRMAAQGWNEILSEGGPQLLRDLLAAGVADELCLTTVPRLIAGQHLRVTHGEPIDVPLEPLLLLEEDGTLLGRWLVADRVS